MPNFEETLSSFKSKYSRSDYEEKKLVWNDFEEWKSDISLILASLPHKDKVSAGQQAWELVAAKPASRQWQRSERAHEYCFGAYCCADILRAVLFKGVAGHLTSLLRIHNEARIAALKQEAETTLHHYSKSAPEELAKALLREMSDGSLAHLSFLEVDHVLVEALLNSIEEPLRILEQFSVLLRAKPDQQFLESLTTRLVERWGDKIAEHAAAEVAHGNLEHLGVLSDRGIHSTLVLKRLLELMTGKWAWTIGHQKDHESPDQQLLLIASDYSSNPVFANHRSDVCSAYLAILRVADTKLAYLRDPLIDALGKVSSEQELPDLIYEVERNRLAIEKSDHYSYSGLQTERERWQTKRDSAISRFSEPLVTKVTELIGLFEALNPRDKWGYRSDLDEQRRFMIRRDAIDLLRSNADLLKACQRFLLSRYSEMKDDVVALLTNALEGHPTSDLECIANDEANSDARLAARLVMEHLTGSPELHLLPKDRFSSVSHLLAYYDDIISSRGKSHSGRTWLQDELTERFVHDAFVRADEDFSRFFEDNHSKYEEGLTERLLYCLEERVRPVSSFLKEWSGKLRNGPIKIELSYRDTQPVERIWNADIAFLFECSIRGVLAKRHAVLVQCKKMAYDNNAHRFRPSWRIDTTQCDNLISKSPFSYYFLFGPAESPSIKTLVVPAQTLRGLVRGMNPATVPAAKTISVEPVRSIARHFADFMLYDLIGCWLGDERSDLIGLAEGADTNAPPARYLVRIVITQGAEQ